MREQQAATGPHRQKGQSVRVKKRAMVSRILA